MPPGTVAQADPRGADVVGGGGMPDEPLVVDDVVYVNSCGSDNGPGYLEAYRIIVD